MKKLFFLFLALSTLTIFGESEEHINAANTLANNGYIVNQSQDTKKYNLEKTILRQEAIGIITKVNGLVGGGDSGYICQNKFLDVSNNDGWVCYVAESAASANVINPNNARFRPKDNMTRFEAMILAFKGSCIQPIDATNNDSALDQVKNIAINTGVISNASIEMNTPVTRGEFFTYITRAQNYKESNIGEIDPTLPGCKAFTEVKLQEVSAKIPTNMIRVSEDPEILYEDYYDDNNTQARMSLGIYESEGKTDIMALTNEWIQSYKESIKDFQLLQNYSWKGGRVIAYTWNEENPDVSGHTKVYQYMIIKNGVVYTVSFALPLFQDNGSQGIKNSIFNSISIENIRGNVSV